MGCQGFEIEGVADINVFLRVIVTVDKDLADLVFGFGIFAFVGIVILEEKLAVATVDDGLSSRPRTISHFGRDGVVPFGRNTFVSNGELAECGL